MQKGHNKKVTDNISLAAVWESKCNYSDDTQKLLQHVDGDADYPAKFSIINKSILVADRFDYFLFDPVCPAMDLHWHYSALQKCCHSQPLDCTLLQPLNRYGLLLHLCQDLMEHPGLPERLYSHHSFRFYL